MKTKAMLAALSLTLFLSACGGNTQGINGKAIQDGEEVIEVKEAIVESDTDEVKSEAAVEEYKGNIEHYVYFDDETMSDFEKAFDDKDYTFDPFIPEDGQVIYVYDTHLADYNLSINNVLYYMEDDYGYLMMRDARTNYVFPDKLEGTKISRDEKDFLNDLLALKTSGCPLTSHKNNDRASENEATEENFKKTLEMVKITGSAQVFIQQSAEAVSYCVGENMGYNYTDGNYDFHVYSEDEIKEGIRTAKTFIDKQEDYLFEIESMKDDSDYFFSNFATILNMNESLTYNKNKQAYIEDLKLDFETFLPYMKEFVKWSGEPTDEYHMTNDEDYYNSRLDGYDSILKQLKEEEEAYLLTIAEQMKLNGLGSLLEF